MAMFASVEEAWADLSQTMGISTLSEEQQQVFRSMFLAGAVAVYKVFQSGTDPFDEVDAAVKELAAWKSR
jgi:hypothetical protein